MKYVKTLLSLLLAGLILSTACPPVLAADSQLAPAGLCLDGSDSAVTTVIDMNGSELTLSGAVDLEQTEKYRIIESINSYEVRYNNEPIMTVEPHDIAAVGASTAMCSGYYAIDFPIPGTTRDCFLTGLPSERVDIVQQKLIDAYTLDPSGFKLEDIGFIDADKNYVSDSEMCWAGACSDMLQYSGWGAQAGFADEDAIFQIYSENFVNDGFYEKPALLWFFNGNLAYRFTAEHYLTYPDSGGYLNDYCGEDYVENHRFNFDSEREYAAEIKKLCDYLRSGYAVGFNVYPTKSAIEAHALAMWGFITDSAVSEDDPAHYTHFIYCDNEDGSMVGTDRRTAPNEMYVAASGMYYDADGNLNESPTLFATINDMPLIEYITLAPYSDAIEKETDPRATKDKINSPDLLISDIIVCNSDDRDVTGTSAYAGKDMTLFFDIKNLSDVIYNGVFSGELTLYRGKEALMTTAFSSEDSSINRNSGEKLSIGLGALEAGAYTAQISVDSVPSIREAYYINNTKRFDFTVVNSPYEISSMRLGAEYEKDKTAITLPVKPVYDDIDPQLIADADKAALMICYSDTGEEDSFKYFSDIETQGSSAVYPLLPETILVDNISQYFKLRLYLFVDTYIYSADSPVYEAGRLAFQAEFLNEEDLSPLPYGSTSLQDGEQLRYRIVNTTTADTDPVTVSYSLVYKAHADEDYVRVSQPREITLAHGESSPAYAVSDFGMPLTGSGNIYVLFECDTDEGRFEDTYLLTELSVREKGSNIVTLPEDITYAYDGLTSLREAIRYCEENGIDEISFDPACRSAIVADTLTINGDIHIAGSSAYDPVAITLESEAEGGMLFDITSGGSLSLSKLLLSKSYDTSTDVFIRSSGSLMAADCRFSGITMHNEGSILDIASGEAHLTNTVIDGSNAANIVRIDNGAKAELLNCLMYECSGDNSLYVGDASCNLISCLISATSGIHSDGVCSVINSILNISQKIEATGSVSLYGTAYCRSDDNVTADAFSGIYPIDELMETGIWSMPVINPVGDSVYAVPVLLNTARGGCYVSEHDGVLCLSKDGESYRDIDVETSFSGDELSHDILGIRRRAIFGPYSMIKGEYISGDADDNAEVDTNDVTVIRRYEAHLNVPCSQASLMQGDVDGDGELSIIDATWIQRYLAHLKTKHPIGEITG